MKRRHPERHIQAAIVKLLRSLGAHVYTLGTTRRKGDYQGTMQTPGLPDVIAFMPGRRISNHAVQMGRILFVEVKAPKGRPSMPQMMFAALCFDAGVAHVMGGVDDVIKWLIDNNYLRADQVATHHTEQS